MRHIPDFISLAAGTTNACIRIIETALWSIIANAGLAPVWIVHPSAPFLEVIFLKAESDLIASIT